MSINMADVKKIQMPFPATIYKKVFSFTNSNVVYRGTSTPCPIDVTLYSTTTPAWTGATDTSTSDIWDYITTTLGYEITAATPTRVYLIVDNPYEFEYINNNQSCVLASCQVRSIAQGNSYFVPWFSVPGAGSVHVGSEYTITEKTGWVLVGTFNEYDYYFKLYLDSTTGSYTNFNVSKDIITGEEYIVNYCINGVSYPNVTITSVSGDTYYLSDGHSYTTTTYNLKTFGGLQEVKKIENLNGDVLWQKKVAQGYHIKYSTSYYINHGTSYYVTSSSTASTVWYIDEDNRIYCLDGTTKLYLQFQTSGNRVVYADTQTGTGYEWLYKDGNFITGTYSGTTYYLYRYGTGNTGVRMRTSTATLTFEPVSST